MIEAHVDTSNLEAALAEFATLTGKELKQVTKDQAGILVGHVIAITPPGGKEAFSDKGGIANSAKKAGESAIESDIRKLFPTSRIKGPRLQGMVEAGFPFRCGRSKDIVREVAETEDDLARIHKFARNPDTGRTRKARGYNMAITRSKVLNAYIRKQKQKVGLLNAGWINAARELKTASHAVPAWIKRHGAKPGGADVRDRGNTIALRIYNLQTYFPATMESLVARAMRRRESGLRKAMAAILEKRAKAAERRMG